MGTTLLIAAALLAQSATTVAAQEPGKDQVDVAYEEMSAGHTADAIAEIKGNSRLSADDPAALINLGTAYARMGHRDKALEYFKAAIASRIRYDVQLGDGRWMDSRQAARRAIKALEKSDNLALR